MHDPAPPRLYVPGEHCTAVALVDPAAHAYPAEHGPEQLVELRPEVTPYLPARQAPLQASVVSPKESPYRPGLHCVHDPAPPRLYVPGEHRTAVALVDPTGHACPAEHGPEQLVELRPEVAPYLPAGHAPLQASVVSP